MNIRYKYCVVGYTKFFFCSIKLINYLQSVSINSCSLKTIPMENIPYFPYLTSAYQSKSKYIHRNGENTLLNIFRIPVRTLLCYNVLSKRQNGCFFLSMCVCGICSSCLFSILFVQKAYVMFTECS